jgi:hypothetical protein
MLRHLILITFLIPVSTMASPWFDGKPDFLDDASRELSQEVLDAHGGMAEMAKASSLKFQFFTKVINARSPFYSIEALDLETGSAYIDWPFWGATIAWDRNQLWSQSWPMPMPAGFFVRLTSSFLTLPWQIQANGTNIGPVSKGQLPEDDTEYDVLRVTFDQQNPGIPGTFYEIYIHPETRLMAGLRFDINHPGMVANPNQPLGPNFHVFKNYRNVAGLVLPAYYVSYGQGSSNGGTSNAHHFVWDVQIDEPFDAERLVAPEDATLDDVSGDWWNTAPKISSLAIEPKTPLQLTGELQ